ncbi:MAG: tripartite tricarboxylate transporter substrate binding protein [Betaproteobacteria bacterium]|nr:tripartite tricarboxylate transporter substrate binding protein [Betaproteobacteria bacterium]
MNNRSHPAILLIAMTLAAAVALPLGAQSFPSQPMRLVVPFPAGGGVDLVARIVAAPLSQQLGQPVVVENRSGAGGAVGATAVAQAQPDGYTLLVGANSTHGTNPSVQLKQSYDPVRDFAPVVLISTSPLFLLSANALQAGSAEDLIWLARRSPGKLNFGSYGNGSITHLTAELFNSMAGIQTNHVPYRGSAPALTDLAAGRIDFVFDGVSALGYVKAGSMRALATAGAKRVPSVLDRPALAEGAVPGFDISLWFGVFAPAATPRTALDVLNARMNAALAESPVRQAIEKIGMEVAGGEPAMLSRRVEAELRRWGTLAREKNIRADP